MTGGCFVSGIESLRALTGRARLALIAGTALLLGGLAEGSWITTLAGLGLLVWAGWKVSTGGRPTDAPWPMPADFRELVAGMARPIDPTPKRVLPPDEKSSIIAHVATTEEQLARLIADRPPAWPWAVFTSVLVQRRNGVQARLRACASGYQPRPGLAPLTGQAYSRTVYQAMTTIADQVAQLESFMLSPAFKGAFGADEESAHAPAIVAVADRLMDYHEAFLRQAEACLQTPVLPEARVFVADAGTFALCPLVGFEQFIPTMCARIGDAQDLLPYADPDSTVALDDVVLTIPMPDGLADRVSAQAKRFIS
ncbi:MAG: hypothetical protein ACKOQ4_03345 [Mycobacterium sp.]